MKMIKCYAIIRPNKTKSLFHSTWRSLRGDFDIWYPRSGHFVYGQHLGSRGLLIGVESRPTSEEEAYFQDQSSTERNTSTKLVTWNSHDSRPTSQEEAYCQDQSSTDRNTSTKLVTWNSHDSRPTSGRSLFSRPIVNWEKLKHKTCDLEQPWQ
jgi:hypothetical protein